MSSVFGAPLLDIEAIDPLRLPRDVLDPKICQAYRVIVLSKRNNRLIVATADPTDQEAAEKIKFTTQMGVDWIIAEYDKLVRLVDATTKSTTETMESMVSGGDFEFDDLPSQESTEAQDTAATEVEDAPIVKFLHKMLLDAFNMRASTCTSSRTSTSTGSASGSTASCARSRRRPSRSRRSWPRASR